MERLIERLAENHTLSIDEYEQLIAHRTPQTATLLAEYADKVRRAVYGDEIYLRGLIEISNYCKNDCLYCGIRRSQKCERYRLSMEEILSCCEEGYELGFRTFVLQGGEDMWYTDEKLCECIGQIKRRYPDCAVTLSLGERGRESFERLYKAGADRYLLRHETATDTHYNMLHPKEMTLQSRMTALQDLKEIGYQVGCGFMVGSPHQTPRHIAQDLKFIEEFSPAMCGIGPFIPAEGTPFADKSAGSVELTCYLISILRLIKPNLLIPATTALGTLDEKGREKGILAGANVVMPNLSPIQVRNKYQLYNHKISQGAESAQQKDALIKRMEAIGYRVVVDRGDIKE